MRELERLKMFAGEKPHDYHLRVPRKLWIRFKAVANKMSMRAGHEITCRDLIIEFMEKITSDYRH